MNGWQLPVQAVIGEQTYGINADYRNILRIFSFFEDPDLPEFIRWRIALTLFYTQPIPHRHRQAAMEYLDWFICGGQQLQPAPGGKLLDWEQDAAVIAADINKTAGQEIRSLPFLHWWTFLGWFRAMGEGQLSLLVGIRDKLRKGKPLEKWEQEYYRENRSAVELKKRLSRAQKDQLEKLEQMLQ